MLRSKASTLIRLCEDGSAQKDEEFQLRD